MLASTVKFSKYVRSHISSRACQVPLRVNLVVRGGMWSEETNSYELIPQDPTVCLIR